MEPTGQNSSAPAPVTPAEPIQQVPVQPTQLKDPVTLTPVSAPPSVSSSYVPPGSPPSGADSPPAAGSPPVPPVAHSPHPVILIAVVLLVVLLAGGAAAAMLYFTPKPEPEVPAAVVVQPTSTPEPSPTPTMEPEATTSAELDGRPLPETGEDIDDELELLDNTVNDGAEDDYEPTMLQVIEQ